MSRGWFAPMASVVSISLHFEHTNVILTHKKHQTIYIVSFDCGISNIVFILRGSTQKTLHTVSLMSHYIVIQIIQTYALH